MSDFWPWLALAGLGLFHGLNPAMGWLFAVALGLHRQSQRIVLLALIPIAIGHMLSITVVVALVMAIGTVLNLRFLGLLSGAALLGWAAYHAIYGHRHRVRFGMQTGLIGLGIWSFLMATAHGAGLMLIPALLPMAGAHAHQHGPGSNELLLAGAAIALHTGATLCAAAVIAIAVYRWIGLAILRSSWINFDILWTVTLVATGVIVIWVGW